MTSVSWIGCFFCHGCGAKAKTPNGLPSITWRKIDGRWYCGRCSSSR